MRFCPAVIACLALPLSSGAQQPIRVDVRLVNVAFSVRDSHGNLVNTLSQDDFEISEDGTPQKVSFFSRANDIPLNLALIEDFSSSQNPFIKSHQRDLETFLKTALNQRDRAFLVAFAKNPWLLSEYSSSPKQLMDSLRGFEQAKNRGVYPRLGSVEIRDNCCSTAFYDAVYYSVTQMLSTAGQGRKAAILFSDGEDNLSAHNMMEVIEAAQVHDAVLFSLRYTQSDGGRITARNKYGTGVMKRLAQETGGAEFDATEGRLADHFHEIAEQLRSSYELAYYPSNPAEDETFRKISIKVKQPGLTVRAKSGYYRR